MGNAQSQQDGISNAAALSLSPRAQQRLSQAPTYMNFFEVASVAHSAPPSKPKKRPSTTNDESSTKSKSSGGSISGNSNGNSTSNGTSTIPSRDSHEKRPSLSRTLSASNVSSSGQHKSSYSFSTSTISDTSPLVHPYSRHQPTNNKGTKLEVTTIGNRQYLASAETRFFLPVDEEESDRLVVMHFLLKFAFNGSIFKAPVGDLLRHGDRCHVLDIGCGSGTWVLEMASDFPDAEIYGVDMVPLYPSTIKPINAKFLQHDILHSLPFPDDTLDYVHMRMMLCKLTQAQIIRMLSEIKRVLKPGGFVELVDVDYRVQKAGPINEELVNYKLYETMRGRDIDFQLCYHLSMLLMTQGGGFINVHQDRVPIPLGWDGQLGQVHGQNIEAFFKSLHPSIRSACTTPNFPDGLTEGAAHEAMLECQKYQSHYNWYACYAQKPMDSFAGCPALPTTPPPVPPIKYGNSTTTTPLPKRRFDKSSSAAAAGPVIVEETWESINDFIDGYVD